MLVQTRSIYGFIIGAFSASVFPIWVLFITPFIFIVSVVLRPSMLWPVFMFVIGSAWVEWHWAVANNQALPESAGRLEVVLQGEVRRVRTQGQNIHFQFRTTSDYGQLKVSCYQCPWKLQQGARWRFSIRLKPIHSFSNPNGFDYRRWMITKGYSAHGYVNLKSDKNLELSSGQTFANRLAELLDEQQFPIIRALVLGDKTGIAIEFKRLIQQGGISHLFVVSGLHVGIVAGFFGLLIFWLQRPLVLIDWQYAKEVAIVSALLAAVVYGWVTGFGVPAIRAVIMLLCAGLLILSLKNIHVIWYWLTALLFVLVLNPLAFMDMGSWLSFLIVLALLVGFSGTAKGGFAPSLVKAQWLAMCVGGLVLIAYNQALVPLSFFVNLLLIPLFSLLVMPGILLAVVLAFFNHLELLKYIEILLEQLLVLLLNMDDWVTWWLPIHNGNRWLVFVSIGLLLLPSFTSLRLLGGVALTASLLIPVKNLDTGSFKLVVLDVGQGSSAMIHTQNKNILVDTGAQFSSGLTIADMVVMPYMRQNTIRDLDLLHITHTDNDHAGGLNLLKSKSKWVIGQSNCLPEQWQWDDVLFERFQAPKYKTGNNGSCLLKVTSASGKSVLFAGDIEKEAEMDLVSTEGIDVSSTVLIAPHHGSKSSSSAGFLKKVGSEMVIISAGFLNPYNHPHEQSLNNYRALNMQIFNTAVNGAVQVEFPARQAALVVSTYRPQFELTQ